MSKSEKLEKLDGLVLDQMIAFMETKNYEAIKELTTAVQYLKANQVVEPPKKHDSDPIEERKKKLEEAKKRRGQQVQ